MQGRAGQGRGEVELGEVPWRWFAVAIPFPSCAPRDEEARGRQVWKPLTSRSALFEPVPKRENFTIHVEI